MQPYIGITCGEVKNETVPWYPTTYGQTFTYVEAIVRAGGVPVILPLVRDKTTRRKLYDLCQAILFAGGNDVNPKRYSQAPVEQTVHISDLRDAQEAQLFRWSIEDKKPFLAICRGMQLLNVVQGGTLYQHIPNDFPAALDHIASQTKQDVRHLAHEIIVEPESRLARAIGVTKLDANSNHHQAIDRLGDRLTATAWTTDGVIEAIELAAEHFAVGVQSHPEALEATMPEWRRLFTSFVAAV